MKATSKKLGKAQVMWATKTPYGKFCEVFETRSQARLHRMVSGSVVKVEVKEIK